MEAQIFLVIVSMLASCGMSSDSDDCLLNEGVCKRNPDDSCQRLPGRCDENEVCCLKAKNFVKRICKDKGPCTREAGHCIPQDSPCKGVSSDSLCKGASCKCCMGNTPSCTRSPECHFRGGFCFKTSIDDACVGGTVLANGCQGKGCSCCIPKEAFCNCGVANDVRIVGGEEISPFHKYPWLVGLLQPSKYGNEYFCGGSVINPNYVLTAAHCMFDRTFRPLPAKKFKVGVADHNFNEQDDDVPGVTRAVEVSSYLIHESYMPGDFSDLSNDIALLRLAETLDLSSYPELRPVCLPTDPSKSYVGETATVIGWGDMSNGEGDYPDAAREVQIPVVKCKKKVAGALITPQMMCAGKAKTKKKGAKGACYGDSGGPLAVVENGKYTVVGIVSFGQSCYKPAVYVRVTEYLDWISTNTADAQYCQ